MKRKSTVSMAPSALAAAERQAAAGGFKDVDEYLAWLVCMDGLDQSVPTFEKELLPRLRAMPQPVSDADVLRVKREIGNRRLAELRRELAAGIEQADRGAVEPLDVEAIVARGRERLAAERATGRAPAEQVP